MDTDTEEHQIFDPCGDGTPNQPFIPWYLQPLKDPRFNISLARQSLKKTDIILANDRYYGCIK